MVLSVIVPLFKLSKGSNLILLNNLLTSVFTSLTNSLLQPNDYEVILVNDYCNENYEGEINAFCHKAGFTEVRYFTNKINIGQAASRNVGANYSKGELLHFIDQDDFINKDFYSSLLKIYSNIRFAVAYIVRDSLSPKMYSNQRYLSKIKQSSFLNQLYLIHFANVAVSPGQYLVERKVYKAVGGFPELKTRGADDYGFLYLLMAKNDCTVGVAEDALFYYRLHSNQNRNTSSMDKSVAEFFHYSNSTGTIKDQFLRTIQTRFPLIHRIIRKCVSLYFFNRV